MIALNDIKDHVETDLGDAALARILNAEAATVDEIAGKATGIVEVKCASGTDTIYLRQPIKAITSIKERRSRQGEQTTLEATDYRTIGQFGVFRNGGSWGEEVEVVYDADIDDSRRDMAIINLAKLTIEFRGLDKEQVDDWAGEQRRYEEQRQAILSELNTARPF